MDLSTLLIVEDEEDVLGVLVSYLTGLGYRVLSASSHAGVLDQLTTECVVDLAVVDWTLPDGTGEDVVRAIRARHPACLFIVTTGHGAEVVGDVQIRGIHAGGLVRKPFTMRSLSQRVAALLDHTADAPRG